MFSFTTALNLAVFKWGNPLPSAVNWQTFSRSMTLLDDLGDSKGVRVKTVCRLVVEPVHAARLLSSLMYRPKSARNDTNSSHIMLTPGLTARCLYACSYFSVLHIKSLAIVRGWYNTALYCSPGLSTSERTQYNLMTGRVWFAGSNPSVYCVNLLPS